jgi:hypothetical protein
MSIILTTQQVNNRRIMVQDQSGKKVHKTPSQPKAGHGGAHLSSQLCRKFK